MSLLNLASRKPFDSGGLLPWFTRPESSEPRQRQLFSEPRDKVLTELQVSLDDASSWHERGWLAFDPGQRENLEPDYIGALIFVRNVVCSGMPRTLLDALFRKLPPTYLPDPARLAYSFTFGWVESAPPPDPHEIILEHLDHWLVSLAEDADVDSLDDLAARVAELLEQTAEDAGDKEDMEE